MRFRALIALDHAPARRYLNHTHALMVQAPRLRGPGGSRIFPAEICWDDEEPLYPGDHAEVTITVIDGETSEFFDGGQRITLWAGGDVGHGRAGGWSKAPAVRNTAGNDRSQKWQFAQHRGG